MLTRHWQFDLHFGLPLDTCKAVSSNAVLFDSILGDTVKRTGDIASTTVQLQLHHHHTFQFLPLEHPAAASNSEGLSTEELPGRLNLILSSSLTLPSSRLPVICLHTTGTSLGA